MRATVMSIIMIAAGNLAGLGCSDSDSGKEGIDPDEATQQEVDRFSETAGHLMVRTDANGLPESNVAIDFDEPPFITQGLGPQGEVARYYNFDKQPTKPADIYVLFKAGSDEPVQGQLNIIDKIPGDAGYNDFWRVVKVTVPTDYVANSAVSLDDLRNSDFAEEPTQLIVNCPVVPYGSTAKMRFAGGSDLQRGWYQGKVVHYFSFEEASLSPVDEKVPTSPIYVAFNVNPDVDGGGPASGFVTENNTLQTHNVLATLPGDSGYSPLWNVQVYDNSDFGSVADLATAEQTRILGASVANVNCPVVDVQ